MAVLVYVVLVKVRPPLEIAGGAPQSTGEQTGAVPDHKLEDWHVRVVAPLAAYPALQAYVATSANSVPVGVLTVPFTGLPSAPQEISTQVGAGVQEPLARQVLVKGPLAVNPALQA